MGSSRILEYILRVKDEASAAFKKVSQNADQVGLAMVKIGAAPTAALVLSAKAAIEFESAFAGIRKTVDASESEFAQLEKNIRDIAKSAPVSTTELSNIGEMAGQLGVSGVGNLTKFIDTISKMSVTTNLTSESAATDFARIANIMQEPIDNIDRMGSAVVDLGNNFATTESDVVNFATRIAGAGNIAGLTTADIFGIGAAMSSVGVEAEAGGTAVQKVLLAMKQAVVEGNGDLEVFAKTANYTGEEFKKAFEENAGAAFSRFVMGLGDQGDQALGTLSDLGLEDQRLIRSFLSLANAGDLVAQSLVTSGQAFEENTALTIEAQKRYETTQSQLIVLKNNLNDVAITLGQALLPAVNNLVEALVPLINKFAEFTKEHPNLVTGILGIGAAIGVLGTVILVSNQYVKAFVTVFKGLKALNSIIPIFTGITKVISLMGGAIVKLGALMLANPIILVIMAIIAALVLLYLAWKNNFGGIQDKTKAALEWIKGKFTEFVDWISGIPGKIADIFTGLFDLIVKGDFTGKLGRALGISEDSPLVLGIIGFRDKVIEVWNGIIEFFVSIPERVGQMVDAIANWFLTLPERIAFALGFIVGTFVNWAETMWVFFTETIPMWIEQIVLWFSTLPERIWFWLTDLYNRFMEWATVTWEFLSTTITYWVEQIVAWISELPGRVWAWLVELYNKFVNWGKNTWSYLSTNIPIWFNQVVEWVKALPGRVWTALSELYSKIKSRFEEAWKAIVDEISSWPGKLVDWGKRIAQSFVDGIKQGLSNLKDAFMDGFNSARGAIEGHSPPKEGVFKDIDKWGYNVGQAWIDGFRDAIGGLDMPAMSSAGGSGYGASQVSNTTQAPIYLNATINNDMDAYELAQILGFELEMRGRG